MPNKQKSVRPVYLESFQNGKLDAAIKKLEEMLKACVICPRKCKVNRLKGERGFCKTGCKPKVYSYMAHRGEEPAISGVKGSGTIFFSNCNMGCVYCQNYEFSQMGRGREVEFQDLAGYMLELQSRECHNINLVTPTHVLPQILKSLKIAITLGLNIPLVYNTSGYELPEIIQLLDGIIDIYLPDMRYADEPCAVKFSLAEGYPEYNRQALKEMFRQVGNAQLDENGIMERGIIIRHLVLPNNISGTEKIMQFIAQELSTDTYISLMSQYLPYHRAQEFKEISRRLKLKEYTQAKEIMDKYNLHNGWVQESLASERFAGVNIKSVLKDG
ncbi:MAG: radical SAM protein [Candidatus Omnitrophica bacterium]|nr:radical SAM protein [Candidatus Omnitrophota bacterium]